MRLQLLNMSADKSAAAQPNMVAVIVEQVVRPACFKVVYIVLAPEVEQYETKASNLFHVIHDL